MFRVSLLTVRKTLNTHALHMPLLVNRRLLKNSGIELNLCYRLSDGVFDADAVIFNSKYFISPCWNGPRSGIYPLLSAARKKAGRVLWFDTTDSTGTGQFDVLPYVDGYYKGHVLKNREDYLRKYYGERIYSDYYHSRFGVEEKAVHPEFPLPEKQHLKKIEIYWNPCLGDYGNYAPLFYRLRNASDIFFFRTISFTPPGKERTRDVSCRIGVRYMRDTVRFHREKIVEMLKKRFNLNMDKVSFREYLRELRRSKIGVSPFGSGEFAYRDYEIIAAGAMLLKPDLSHLATWPDLYGPGLTYVPFKWDFSDLAEAVELCLQGKKRLEIASR